MRRTSLRIAPLTDQRAWRSEYATAAGIKLTSVPDPSFDVMDSFARASELPTGSIKTVRLFSEGRLKKPPQMRDDHMEVDCGKLVPGNEGAPLSLLGFVVGKFIR